MVAVVEAAAEQQRRERERHEAHARFEAIFNHSNDAIFVLDPEADEFLDINPQACALLGYPREELLELRPSDIHAHEVAALRGFAERVLKEGASWTNELSCLDRHGQVVPCEISASRVELDGRWWVLAMVRDVRDRKRVEQELREAQARYRDLFEEAPTPTSRERRRAGAHGRPSHRGAVGL